MCPSTQQGGNIAGGLQPNRRKGSVWGRGGTQEGRDVQGNGSLSSGDGVTFREISRADLEVSRMKYAEHLATPKVDSTGSLISPFQ